MSEGSTGKMQAGCFEFETRCDICRKRRNVGNHSKCSRKRQEMHQQMIRNEEFDRLLMDDGKK